MRGPVVLLCALLCAVAGAMPEGDTFSRSLLAAAPKLYCERPDSGNRLVGGRLIATIKIKVNGRPVNEINADCCNACNAAAGKGCRKFWAIFTEGAPFAECQLKTADAKVVPCFPNCKYDNGKPAPTEFLSTGSMLPSKCGTNPGNPTPSGNAQIYKGQRVEGVKPFKSLKAMTSDEAIWAACQKACAAVPRCQAFNYQLANSRCDLIDLPNGKPVQYCSDINIYAGVMKPGKPQKG